MAVAFDSAVQFAEEDSTTPTSTASWTIASTADRWAICAMLSRDFGTPASHSGMTLEGVSMTAQLGSTANINGDTTAGVSRWNLFGGGEPAAGSSRTLVGTLSTIQSVGMVLSSVYNGVHQTTPVNSTPTATDDHWEDLTEVTPHPSITVTTVTGGKAVAVLALTSSTGGAPSSITGTGVTVRAVASQNGNTLYILEKDDTSGSTTIDVTVTYATSTGDWRMDGYGVQPTASGTSITSGLGQLALTGLVPTLVATANQFVSSGLGALTITGFAPTLSATGNHSRTPDLGQLTITGHVPSVSTSGSVSITTALGQLTITGYAPDQTLTLYSPEPAALVLTGHAPTLAVDKALSTGLGQLVITGFAPSLAATGNQFASPGLGALTITGLAPTAVATGHQFVAPEIGQLTIAGYAPSLIQAGSFSVTPGLGILEILGLAPDVETSGRRKHAGTNRRRRRIIERQLKEEMLDEQEEKRVIKIKKIGTVQKTDPIEDDEDLMAML